MCFIKFPIDFHTLFFFSFALCSVRECGDSHRPFFSGAVVIVGSYDTRGRQERCEGLKMVPRVCPVLGKSRQAHVDLWNERRVNDEEKRLVVQ